MENMKPDCSTFDERRNIIFGNCIWALGRKLISADDEEIDLIWNDKRRLVFVFDEKKAYIDTSIGNNK